MFVPAISYVQVDDSTLSAVVWTDAIPVLLPQVDAVAIYRDDIRQRQWFRPFGGPEIAVVRWDELLAQLPKTALSSGSLPYIDLSDLRPSSSLIQFLRQVPAAPKGLAGRSYHSVLDRELLPSAG